MFGALEHRKIWIKKTSVFGHFSRSEYPHKIIEFNTTQKNEEIPNGKLQFLCSAKKAR